MIQAVLLASLGVPALDDNGFDLARLREAATGLLWLLLIHAEAGGPVTGSVMRGDPGTMGRTLFHFRTTPRDGRHGLAYVELGGKLVTADLPSLPALCALVRVVRVDLAAGRVPDLEDLAPRHLGRALTLPPVEMRPGGFGCRVWLGKPDAGTNRAL